ncbi:hypothetical protein C2S51_038624, partial [Perilla frutescens var. frutescens]
VTSPHSNTTLAHRYFLEYSEEPIDGEFSSFPYICMVLNASLWTYYGIIKPNSLLIATVNGSGIIISTVYLSLFYSLLPQKLGQVAQVKTAAVAAVMDVGILAVGIWVSEWWG